MKRFLIGFMGAALVLGNTAAASARLVPKSTKQELAINHVDAMPTIVLEYSYTTQLVDSPSVTVPAAVVPNRLYQLAEGAKFWTYHNKQLRLEVGGAR